MTQWLLFGAGSILLVAVSRRTFSRRGAHGSYRFVAWEAMLGMLVINGEVWSVDPLAPHQLLSWILLTASLALVIVGARDLGRRGALDPRREDGTLFRYEKTTRLVTSGTYRFIRHPLYGSLLLLAWGIFLKQVTVVTVPLVVIATAFLWLTARADERECLDYFGGEYAEYMKTTKMFIPFIW